MNLNIMKNQMQKDFFAKFYNQILVTKLFLENSLKKVVFNYFSEFAKIKIDHLDKYIKYLTKL